MQKKQAKNWGSVFQKWEMNIYCVEKYVVYGIHWICEMEEVTNLKFGSDSHARDYYVLRPVFEKSMKIYVPVENSTVSERMRPILSQKEIDEIILSITDTEIKWDNNYKKRSEQFHKILSERDEREILRMISCLYLHAKESGKGLTSSNAQVLKAAQNIIEQEFAFSLNIKPQEVGKYIQMKLGLIDSLHH